MSYIELPNLGLKLSVKCSQMELKQQSKLGWKTCTSSRCPRKVRCGGDGYMVMRIGMK